MDLLRTPDERFVNLPDYPFAPHYEEFGVMLALEFAPLFSSGRHMWLEQGHPLLLWL